MAKSRKVKGIKPKTKTVKVTRDALTSKLLDAIDQMQEMAPGSVVEVRDAPQTAHSHIAWRMAARFILPRGTSYDDIFSTLRDWRDDRGIERTLGGQRLSRIQVRYKDKKTRGSHGEYTLSEIGAWELVASRATERVGVRDDRLESLISRYGADSESPSYIESIIVWFSAHTAKEVKIGRAKFKEEKKKKAKGRRRI